MNTLKELFDKADILKSKINEARPLKEDELKSLNNYFKIGFTYSSNALEGNMLTLSETKVLLEDGLTIGGKPIKDCYEAVGHSDAFDFMLDLAKQKDMKITEDIIKKLHYYFYRKIDAESAGKYRSSQVYISGTKYIPPSPEEINHLMEHFISQIETSKNMFHPIELAAMVHKRLVDIHPFIDGNGRTARLLMNLVLINTGYGIVSIPPILRNEYISTLSLSQTKNDTEPFVKLIAECVIETEKDYCRLLKIT